MFFKSRQFLVCYAFALALLVVSVTSSRLTRQKRSDDGDPLEAVVEQLTQQVTSLNAQLNSVNAEVTALKMKTANLDTTVAFHAFNTVNPVQTAAKGTIILNHVATNIGNAYDPMTGMFTVPVTGLYEFQASIMSAQVGVFQRGAIYVDNDRVAISVSDSSHGQWAQATMKSILHVHAGQKVYLKNIEASAKEFFSFLTEPYTTFSGLLIKAD